MSPTALDCAKNAAASDALLPGGPETHETAELPDFRRRLGLSLTPLAMIMLAVAAAFHPLVMRPAGMLVGPQHDGRNDLTSYFLAAREFAIDSAKLHSQPPLWNPHLLTGTPHAGNPQSAWLYPPNWVYYFTGHPATVASWMMALHHAFAAWGLYLLCRRWRLDCFAAAGGAALLAAAPYWLAHVGEGHYNQICAVAWIPWAMLAFERLREGRRGAVAVMALVLSLSFFAGHVQETFYLALVLTAAATAELIRLAYRGDRAAAAQFLKRGILVSWATVGITAVELAPVWVYTQTSVRGGGMSVVEAGVGLEAANLLQLVWPWALGDPVAYRQPQRFFWENLFYFGVAPAVIAVIGAIFAWRRRATQWSFWLLLGAAAFAFGAASPFYQALYYFVPGVSLFRSPGRSLFFAAVAVSVLAAVGLDVLAARLRKANLRQRWALRLAPAVCLLACLVELSLFSHHVLRTVSATVRGDDAPPGPLARDSGQRILAEQALVSDREAQRWGLSKVQAYEPTLPTRITAVVAAMTKGRDPALALLGFVRLPRAALHKPVVDLLGVRFAVVSPPAEAPAGWRVAAQGWRSPEFSLAAQPRALPYVVLENLSPLPRAYVIGHVKTLNPQRLVQEELADLDPRREVLLATDVLPRGPRSEFRPATIIEDSPCRVVVEAKLDESGYLVLSDAWYPGWRATIDGVHAQVLPANAAFRAVALTPGKHRIVFTYQTPGLRVGGLITAFTLLMLLVGARPRRPPRPAPTPALTLKLATPSSSAALLTVAFMAAFALVGRGTLMSSDEGGIFNTAVALVTRGALDVGPGENIHPGRGGKYFSLREILPTVAATPCVAAGVVLEAVCGGRLPPLAPGPREAGLMDWALTNWPVFLTTLILGPLCGALTLVFLHQFLRLEGVSPRTALLLSLAAGWTTPLVVYSKTIFPQIFEAAILMLCLLLARRWRESPRLATAAGLGVACGLGLLTRTPAFGPVALCFAGCLAFAGAARRGDRKWAVLAFAVPMAAATATAAWVNWFKWGSVLDFGRHGANEAFTTNFLVGASGLLASPGRSIFLYAPILVAPLLAGRTLWRQGAAEVTLLLAVTACYLGIYSQWYDWAGGLCWGPRFLVPLIAPWVALTGRAFLDAPSPVARGAMAIAIPWGLAVQVLGVTVYPHWIWLKRYPDPFSLTEAHLLETARVFFRQGPDDLWILAAPTSWSAVSFAVTLAVGVLVWKRVGAATYENRIEAAP